MMVIRSSSWRLPVTVYVMVVGAGTAATGGSGAGGTVSAGVVVTVTTVSDGRGAAEGVLGGTVAMTVRGAVDGVSSVQPGWAPTDDLVDESLPYISTAVAATATSRTTAAQTATHRQRVTCWS